MTVKYYVAILFNNRHEYITRVDWETKEWYCDDGMNALELTRKQASDLMKELITNGICGAVLEVAPWYTLSNLGGADEKIS